MVVTCGFRSFWKWGNIRKKVRWNRRLRILCTLWIGISRKFHLQFTLIFQLRYYKMVESLGMQKLVSKITGIWTTSGKQWKVQKVETWWAFVQKENILLAKTYTVDLSTITFNYLHVESQSFLKTCHFSQHNSSVSLLAQTLHTFHKSSPSRCKFPTVQFTKFLMSFFK